MIKQPVANKAYRQLHASLGQAKIELVMASFYDKIRAHEKLSVFFAEVKDWDELKARISHFWWIDLGGERYREDIYNPHAVHRFLKIPPELLDDWLALFTANLKQHLDEDSAAAWLARATQMAEWIRTDLIEHQK